MQNWKSGLFCSIVFCKAMNSFEFLVSVVEKVGVRFWSVIWSAFSKTEIFDLRAWWWIAFQCNQIPTYWTNCDQTGIEWQYFILERPWSANHFFQYFFFTFLLDSSNSKTKYCEFTTKIQNYFRRNKSKSNDIKCIFEFFHRLHVWVHFKYRLWNLFKKWELFNVVKPAKPAKPYERT